jgi:hypothetical protein
MEHLLHIFFNGEQDFCLLTRASVKANAQQVSIDTLNNILNFLYKLRGGV